MYALIVLLFGLISAAAMADPVQVSTDDAHLIVIRPIDSWDPNDSTAKYSLDALKSKNFGFQYLDSDGNKIVPSSGGLFRAKQSTPLSDDVFQIMANHGFGNKGSHVYFFSAPVTISPDQMPEFIRAQNRVFRASVVQNGDPATLGSRISAKKAVNVVATAAVAAFGIDKLGANMVNLTQYSTLHTSIAKLTSEASAALLPVPLPDFDFGAFSSIEIRRVTDNAGHLGQILIAYRTPKTPQAERTALAQAIAIAGGVGTTTSEVLMARASDHSRRMEIWNRCQASPGCTQP